MQCISLSSPLPNQDRPTSSPKCFISLDLFNSSVSMSRAEYSYTSLYPYIIIDLISFIVIFAVAFATGQKNTACAS